MDFTEGPVTTSRRKSELRPARRAAARCGSLVAAFAIFAGLPNVRAEPPAAYEIVLERRGPLFANVPVNLTVRALDGSGELLASYSGRVRLEGVRGLAPEPIREGEFQGGVLALRGIRIPEGTVTVSDGRVTASLTRQVLPGWLTLVPPLLAIALAMATRQVLLALFAGVWCGAFILEGFAPFAALLRSVDTYCVNALADRDHVSIVLFSLSLAGMVGIITRAGGVRGVVELIARRAKTARTGQLATWGVGLLIFFDDYANALLVGNTMRPFTDRVRISREKLSFIVDATAAPVATIGIISTWTAYQLGLIQDALERAGHLSDEPYVFFIRSIPSSFYSLLMIAFVFICAATLRDFGPMRTAELRARSTGETLRKGSRPLLDPTLDRLGDREGVVPHWWNAAIPVACVVGFTIAGLYATGLGNLPPGARSLAKLHEIFGKADAYRSLLWAALGASIVAGALALLHGLRLEDVVSSWIDGAKSLVIAAMILVLAWAISRASRDLDTGGYVASIASGRVSPALLPALAFVAAGAISFATGTSYGTMGILIPILLPLAYRLSAEIGASPSAIDRVGLGTLAAILGGSVFGDHCSPISDTTILSSMASGVDHIDHVRTQLPYALTVAALCIPCYVAVGLGASPLVVLPVGAALLLGAFLLLSRGGGKEPPGVPS